MPIVPQPGGPGNGLGCQGAYKWTDVFAVVKELVHQIPVQVIQIYVADIINSIVWLYFPWRWTLFEITPVTLINGTQDYGGGVPVDFQRLIDARIVRTDVTPFQNQPIKIAKHLEVELQRQGSINSIQAVSYEPSVPAFRLDCPPSISGTMAYELRADYQVIPTKITDLNTPICPPDKYFNVLVEGVLWQIYRLADDPRTGTTSINRPGDKTTQGQYAVFRDVLEEMRRQEDLSEGIDSRFPEDPIGWTRWANPGVYPYI